MLSTMLILSPTYSMQDLSSYNTLHSVFHNPSVRVCIARLARFSLLQHITFSLSQPICKSLHCTACKIYIQHITFSLSQPICKSLHCTAWLTVHNRRGPWYQSLTCWFMWTWLQRASENNLATTYHTWPSAACMKWFKVSDRGLDMTQEVWKDAMAACIHDGDDGNDHQNQYHQILWLCKHACM